MKKILFITGSRGEWGYIRPILKLIDLREDMDYCLVVTNMHLLQSYGSTYKEIEKDGFRIDYKVSMCLDGYNHYTMIKSLSVFMMSLPDILEKEKPDWIMLAGDRGEQLVGAMVGAHTYIPVAHIQAGELSGNIDGMTRHAIGKYAHLHLAANKDAAERLIKLGEDDFRVHNVGAPQLDELVNAQYSAVEKLEEKFFIELKNGFILVVLHPVTEESTEAGEQARILIQALNDFNEKKVVIMPNNDAGSYAIKEAIQKNIKGDYKIFKNLTREDYLGFLKNCKCIVGNSSSGLLEAPTFKTPAVNVGRRQDMRCRGVNVIDVDHDITRIKQAINKACSEQFKHYLLEECDNPYGDGYSSKRIVDLLENISINNELIIKKLTY